MKGVVFFCVDDRYFPVAATQAIRVLEVAGSAVEVHIFVDGAGPATSLVAALEERGAGRLHVQVNKLLNHLPREAPIGLTGSRIVYGRLFAPRYIDAERALYLDVDIGLEGALDPLFELDMRGATIAAIPDLELIYEANRRTPLNDPLAGLRYFNAGVILFDCDRWRARDVHSDLRAWAAQNPHERYADQAFLNAAEEGRWLPLSPRWNCQGSLIVSGLATTIAPHIFHFTGWRPWEKPRLPIHVPHADAFRRRAMEADVAPESLDPLRRRKRTWWVKAMTSQLQRGLCQCGLQTPAIRMRREAFVDRLRFFHGYLRQAEELGFFADSFQLGATRTIQPIFDGRQFFGVPGEIEL
jgi:lipopolysaccharide biosynthesis glycosyltransferase